MFCMGNMSQQEVSNHRIGNISERKSLCLQYLVTVIYACK